VLVLHRFRVADADAASFQAEAEESLRLLSEQRGFVDGVVGRNVDDPGLWVLQTRWDGPGAYRRALSAYDVKVGAWALLGRALDEPSAYETVEPGTELNRPDARSLG